MYGTVSESGPSEASRWVLSRRLAVPAAALLVVVATIVLIQSTSPAVELASSSSHMDSAVLRHEKEGIAAAQSRLARLNAQAKAEAALLKKHDVSGKKQAILAQASLTKAKASREVASALLDTVKQHSAEIAKAKDLKLHDKEEAVAKTERAKAASLRKKASKVHAAEVAAAAKAQELSNKAIKDRTLLKQTNAKIDTEMAKVEQDKLAYQNKEADAKAEQHLADLGVASSKARDAKVEHLKNKARRLARKIAQLHRKEKKDESDEEEDTKAAAEYRADTDAARKKKQEMHAEAHKLKLEQKDEDRLADEDERRLQTIDQVVHHADDKVEHLDSRVHEARTALRREQDRLRDAERRIYHAQMKNEADRNPSDADLGLVHV